MTTINDQTLDDLWCIVGPQQNRTKAPFERMQTVFSACKDVIENNVNGDLVEAGVWKGGLSATMGHLCELENKDRKVWAFDSFEGMSAPDPAKDLLDSESSAGACFIDSVQLHNFDLEDFKSTCFDMVGIQKNTINICKGWVNNTIPMFVDQIKEIAILRIDLDWYEPTKEILENLYPKVVNGGYIICDDYGCWRGARLAIDEYRDKHNIVSRLIQTPQPDGSPQPSLSVGTEHYWQK
jgi:O-methyltransferase